MGTELDLDDAANFVHGDKAVQELAELRSELATLREENNRLWDEIHKANSNYKCGRDTHLIFKDLKELEREYSNRLVEQTPPVGDRGCSVHFGTGGQSPGGGSTGRG